MKRGQVKLLIGEDDAGIALDMQRQLTKLGYRVEMQAGTPQEVVSMAIARKPHVIVLDLNIQGDSHGIHVAREIHDIARIPIVFVTTFADDVLENDHAIPRPYRYITKPYILNELDVAIEELWDGISPSARNTAA